MKVKFANFLKGAFFNKYKYSVITAGRRTGKTYAAAIWLCAVLLQNSNKSALWVDTTNNNLEKYYDRYFAKILKGIDYSLDKQKKILKLKNGSYIDFGSAERPENLEGQQYHYGVLNEAGIILKKESLWFNSLQPMFKGDTQVKIIGTPKGKNLFHKLYCKDDPQYKSFHFTAYDSPFWDKNELDKLRKQIPEKIFEQEYLAEFIEGAGVVFRNIKNCIREPQKGLTVDYMGIDLAKHEDFTVITLMNAEHSQVTKIDRFNQIDWTFQKNRIVSTWREAGEPKVLVDSTGAGDPIFDDLLNVGMNIEGYKFTNESKAKLIQSLAMKLDKQEVFFPNDPILINELEVFGFKMTSSGNITYNAPSGFHDDCVISLALASYLNANEEEIIISWI